MGEVIVIGAWLVIGGALAWHFAVSRRRKQQRNHLLRGHAEDEQTIRESRAAGYAGRDFRNYGHGGGH